MDNGQIYAAIIGLIVLALPIIGALWRLFTIKELLQAAIQENRHRVEMLEQKTNHLVDQQGLFLNGIQERLQHVRDRSKHEEEDLDRRLTDLESFLEKSTAFTKRNRG